MNDNLAPCLFVGNDSEFLARLREIFHHRALFQQVSLPAINAAATTAKMAVFLWNHQVSEAAQNLSHRFPKLKVIVEKNERAFQGAMIQNGYAALVEKSQERSQLIASIDAALSELGCGQGPKVQVTKPARKLDLLAWIDRLPEVFRMDEAPKGRALLDSLLAAVKSQQGWICIDRKGATLSARGIPFELTKNAALDYIRNLDCEEDSVVIGENTFADQFLQNTACNILLVFRHEDRVLGCAAINISSAYAGERLALEAIARCMGAALAQHEQHLLEVEKFSQYQDLICSSHRSLMIIGANGRIVHMDGMIDLFHLRGAMTLGAQFSVMSSPALKSTISSVLNGRTDVAYLKCSRTGSHFEVVKMCKGVGVFGQSAYAVQSGACSLGSQPICPTSLVDVSRLMDLLQLDPRIKLNVEGCDQDNLQVCSDVLEEITEILAGISAAEDEKVLAILTKGGASRSSAIILDLHLAPSVKFEAEGGPKVSISRSPFGIRLTVCSFIKNDSERSPAPEMRLPFVDSIGIDEANGRSTNGAITSPDLAGTARGA